MTFTANELEFMDLCRKNVFIAEDVLAVFRDTLAAEGNTDTYNYGLEGFSSETCPNCGATGEFKPGFLGRLKHPDCGLTWYMPTGRYAICQLKSCARVGVDIAVEGDADARKKGEKQGCIAAAASFVFGAILRFLVAIVLIPIQLVVSLISAASRSGKENQ